MTFLDVWNASVDFPLFVQRIDAGKQENMRVRRTGIDWPGLGLEFGSVNVLVFQADAIIEMSDPLLCVGD